MFTRLSAITLLCDFISCSFFPQPHPCSPPTQLIMFSFSGCLVIPWEFQDQYVSFGIKKNQSRILISSFGQRQGLMFPCLVLNSQEICLLLPPVSCLALLAARLLEVGVTKCAGLSGQSHHLQYVQFLINIGYLSVCSFLYHIQLVVIAYACNPVIEERGGEISFPYSYP